MNCHPERSEESASFGELQIPRFARNDKVYRVSGDEVPDKFTVALVQMSCGPEPADNLAKALDRVSEAARKGAHVVCLPELFQTQYFCQREDAALFDLAEPSAWAGTEAMSAAARQNKVVLIASLFEKRAPGLYHNTAAILRS